MKQMNTARGLMAKELADFHGKIIVLDDDPTGTQTIHDVDIYTNWRKETIRQAFQSKEQLFFLLTNSRGLTELETSALHKRIASVVSETAEELGQKFLIVSRSDSTLRGHYPLETETIHECLASKGMKADFEVLCPAYFEGGRITKNNIHYLKKDDILIPVGETEFARDNTFGYHSSDLIAYCQEKSRGKITPDHCVSISIDQKKPAEIERITDVLMGLSSFRKVIVNANSYEELEIFATALMRALNNGKTAILRCASSLVKSLTNEEEQPLLEKHQVVDANNAHGGLIIVGSHVQLTTDQLDCLKEQDTQLKFVEFDVLAFHREGTFEKEIARITAEADKMLEKGNTTVIYTSRKVMKSDQDSKEAHLRLSADISKALTSIANQLTVKPKFIIAKGGITSSDVATIGLEIQKARVLGQIENGVSVWDSGEKSKFPHMPYIIFPGNVGHRKSLKNVVEKLEAIEA